MTGEVFDSIAVKEILIADDTGPRDPDNYVSGAIIISGAKMFIKGATDWEKVTSV